MIEVVLLSIEVMEQKIRSIDKRVKKLEKTNDKYAAKHGHYNDGIYNLIQNLMDERDQLRRNIILMEEENANK